MHPSETFAWLFIAWVALLVLNPPSARLNVGRSVREILEHRKQQRDVGEGAADDA